MANAEIYSKWSSQTDGNRGGGGWSGPHGRGTAAFSTAGTISAVTNHAERVAWREAWIGKIETHIRGSINNFLGQTYQIKFWVDQQICPDCQKWLIIDVITHLKLLPTKFPGLRVELYAEVLFSNVTRKVKVQRSTVWPVEIGLKRTFAEMR